MGEWLVILPTRGGRGVWQGNPLSPLLFCLTEEVLSRALNSLVSNYLLVPMFGPKGLLLPSHVYFAYDIMFFFFFALVRRKLFKIWWVSLHLIKASGQIVSVAKCRFFHDGLPQARLRCIHQILGLMKVLCHLITQGFLYLKVSLKEFI